MARRPIDRGGFTPATRDEPPTPPTDTTPSRGGLISRALRHGGRGVVERRSGKALGGVALGAIPGVPNRPLSGTSDQLGDELRAQGIPVFDGQAAQGELGAYGPRR